VCVAFEVKSFLNPGSDPLKKGVIDEENYMSVYNWIFIMDSTHHFGCRSGGE
jgi:hypothetical protein